MLPGKKPKQQRRYTHKTLFPSHMFSLFRCALLEWNGGVVMCFFFQSKVCLETPALSRNGEKVARVHKRRGPAGKDENETVELIYLVAFLFFLPCSSHVFIRLFFNEKYYFSAPTVFFAFRYRIGCRNQEVERINWYIFVLGCL